MNAHRVNPVQPNLEDEPEHGMSSEEAATLETLLRLINAPARTRETSRQTGVRTHSDLVWKAFVDLSSETRGTLPLHTLKRVLRMVVPPSSVVKKQWQSKIQKCNGTQGSIAEVTVYPYEYRLQAVISAMRRSERSAMEESAEQEQSAHVTERSNPDAFSINDYVFVLRQFATTGYLTGSEQVVKEIERLGLVVDRKVYEARLATLSQWITANLAIRRRFWAYQNSTRADGRRLSGLAKVLWSKRLPGLTNDGTLPAFFPPEIARLLGDVLYSFRFEDALEYRQSALDMLLRVAKELERPEALNAILKAGYGIDLRFPDVPEIGIAPSSPVVTKKGSKRRNKQAEEDWVEQVTRRASPTNQSEQATNATAAKLLDDSTSSKSAPIGAEINVHAMNTLVDGIGASGDVWKMLQTFEVLGHPLKEDGSGCSAATYSQQETRQETSASSTLSEKVIRRTGTVTSTSPDHAVDADPPMTLSEALQREEQSGERLSFFGISSKSDDLPGTSTLPNFFNQAEYNGSVSGEAGSRRAEEFLPRQATPIEIQSRSREAKTVSTLETMDSHAIFEANRRLDTRSRHAYRSNTTTYGTLIRHASRHAAWKMKEDSGAAYAMYSLAGHFLKNATYDMMDRHNAFISQWVQIRQWTLVQRSLVMKEADGEARGHNNQDPSTTATPKQNIPRSLQQRLDAIDSRKTWLRSKIYHPSLIVTPDMVRPLFQALRAGKRLDGARRRVFAQAVEDVQRCVRYLREEWEVLTGRKWQSEAQSTESASNGVESVDPTNNTSTVSSSESSVPSVATSPEFDTTHVALDHRDAAHKFQLAKHLSLLRRDLAGLEELLALESQRLNGDN